MSASMIEVKHGDCRAVLKALPAESIDSVVTDPPYGLRFMGKRWDSEVPSVEVWREVFRVLKPGGHLLSFFGTRTYHRGAVNVEDAGFEIRDQLGWMYGSGFPKSMDVSKAIDKEKGANRKKIQSPARLKPGDTMGTFCGNTDSRPWMQKAAEVGYHEHDGPDPATAEAKHWQGWGTALKPAWEPIVLARKPLRGTVAANVLKHGPGALNIDACRVGDEPMPKTRSIGVPKSPNGSMAFANTYRYDAGTATGRFPANILHDGSLDVLEILGPAARFFYCAKASRKERDASLEGIPERVCGSMEGNLDGSLGKKIPTGKNHHPTVKPLALMRYLVRLVTPLEGTILDPFAGSGTTLLAAKLEGFQAIGIEKEAEYVQIIKVRLK